MEKNISIPEYKESVSYASLIITLVFCPVCFEHNFLANYGVNFLGHCKSW